LREQITRSDVKRLARELILLADPFIDHRHAFRPILVASEFADLEKLVAERYFDDAEYHVCASVDANGFARAVVTDWRKRELFSATHEDLTKGRIRATY
jgi:hypothetical protein